jgi:ABC-2 type transport system permease protein
MNGALFRMMWRLHGKTVWSMALGSLLYVWLIVYVYPSLSPEDLSEMMSKLPPGLMKAFGIEPGVQRLAEFLASKYYTFMFLILLMVYSVMTPVQLVSRLVDRGTMAFLLSASVSRGRVAFTQAAVFLAGLFVICLFTYLGGVTGDRWFLEKPELNHEAFFLLNLAGFLLFAVLGGISFVISCLMDDEKKAMALSSLIAVLFFALDLAGKLGDKLEWMRRLSLFSLFEPMKLVKEGDLGLAVSGGLAAAALVLFTAGVLIFRSRDLTL